MPDINARESKLITAMVSEGFSRDVIVAVIYFQRLLGKDPSIEILRDSVKAYNDWLS